MGDLLKVIAALVLVGAAIKYGAQHLVNEAIAKSGEPGSGYQFEFKPLEIPETNFQWNPNWAADAGIVWPEGGMGKSRTTAVSEDRGVSRSNESSSARQRELSGQVRQMHEAIRNGADPKREMERSRAQLSSRPSSR